MLLCSDPVQCSPVTSLEHSTPKLRVNVFESILGHFRVGLPEPTFESLLGHFNSFCVSVNADFTRLSHLSSPGPFFASKTDSRVKEQESLPQSGQIHTKNCNCVGQLQNRN